MLNDGKEPDLVTGLNRTYAYPSLFSTISNSFYCQRLEYNCKLDFGYL